MSVKIAVEGMTIIYNQTMYGRQVPTAGTPNASSLNIVLDLTQAKTDFGAA